MSKQRKTRKRTIIDIIGEEDYMEYKDVIQNQIHLHQKEEDMLGNLNESSNINKGGKKAKKSQSLKKKQQKQLVRRKT